MAVAKHPAEGDLEMSPREVMKMLKLAALAGLVLATTAGVTTANGPGRTPSGAPTITIIDGGLIQPSRASVRVGDVLEFTNYSAEPMLLLFTEPDDPIDRIRCRAVRVEAPSGAPDPLELAGGASDPRLAAIIPPGRSASSCSLEPGRYEFLMRRVSRDVRAPYDSLGTKGTITVEP
jgi:hypothetical protein